MSRRLIVVLSSVCALALVTGLVVTLLVGHGGTARTAARAGVPAGPTSGSQTTPRIRTADEAGRAFLAEYVDRDGRVVRRDQGGDTVSEGQAYALLVAVATGDRATFDSVWRWTQQRLQRPDGLLSWRWAGGAVTDASSASDADLDTARALVLAGGRFHDAGYTSAGVRLGRAVLELETVRTGAGRILTAGSWATTEPYAYDPSYASPVAFAVLSAASGDLRWDELAAGSRAVTTELLDKAPLPPDWAQVHADGSVEAMPGAQGRGESVRYAYDAARTTIWSAESCDPAGRALAARQLAPLDRGGNGAALDLGGTPIGEGDSVVVATAHAAAVAAAGSPERATAELDAADRLAQTSPSYYGAAWAALGRFTLTDDVLGGCPPVGAAS